MALTADSSLGLLNQFKGALVGALVGDCLGSFFENRRVSDEAVFKHFIDIIKMKNKLDIYKYTDDTAMTRSIAMSMIENKGYSARDMADRFQKDFYNEPFRGYGGNVGSVFAQLRDILLDSETNTDQDIYEPAAGQFDGSGSYGNGGAMRIAPSALFNYNSSLADSESIVTDITRLTHHHKHAILGAILQHHAVHLALHGSKLKKTVSPSKSPQLKKMKGSEDSTTEILDRNSFIESLLTRMKELEKETTEQTYSNSDYEDLDYPERQKNDTIPKLDTYCAKLEAMKTMLDDTSLEYENVVHTLGNGVAAFQSVPTAVFAFLKCLQPVEGVDKVAGNAFERTVIYAVRLGGDTDTIASMAGAIAGAYYGHEAIPYYWTRRCEAVSDAVEQAEELYQIIIPDCDT